MDKDYFNPTDSAAMMTKTIPLKANVPVKPTELAALPVGLRNKPIALPPKPAKTGLPGNNDPYWKSHPLQTEHSDGTIRNWGEQVKSPYTLPRQMMPPPSSSTQPVSGGSKGISDKASGSSDSYYSPVNNPKAKSLETVHSNIQ